MVLFVGFWGFVGGGVLCFLLILAQGHLSIDF